MRKVDIQVQEEQRIPNKIDIKTPTQRHIVIKMPKVKDNERILRAAREKETVTYKGVPIRLSADFSKETLQPRRERNILSHEKQGLTAKTALPSKAVI